MAALAWVFNLDAVDMVPSTGDYIFRIRTTISDPASSPPRVSPGFLTLDVTLAGDAPNTWAASIENAVIAAAAALDPPMTLTAARCILPTFA
jgi:hypothetical protein